MTAAAGESVTVEGVVTLDDQIRYNELLLSAPELRRMYYLRWGAAILLMPPVGLGTGMLVGFLADRSGVPTRDILQALWSDRVSILTAWCVVTALLVAMMIAHRLFRRRWLRARARMLLRERHGLDETPELMVVRTGRFTGFVLPRREFGENEIAAIRRTVAENLGASRVLHGGRSPCRRSTTR